MQPDYTICPSIALPEESKTLQRHPRLRPQPVDSCVYTSYWYSTTQDRQPLTKNVK